MIIFLFALKMAYGQEVPIQQYAVNVNGQVRLEVNSTAGKYYLLQVRHHPDSAFTLTTSMTLGQEGTTILTEPLKAYPIDHYRVLEYAVGAPSDADEDGTDDVTEFSGMPFQAPLNAAGSLPVEHALLSLNTLSAFQAVSTHENATPWVEYLNDMEFAKFIILDFYSAHPKVYFINSNTYDLHEGFADYLEVNHLAPTVKKGTLIYHPSVLSANGTLGTYGFNFSNNEAQEFGIVQRTHELIASNMPYLTNNLAYFITANNEEDYQDCIVELIGPDQAIDTVMLVQGNEKFEFILNNSTLHQINSLITLCWL